VSGDSQWSQQQWHREARSLRDQHLLFGLAQWNTCSRGHSARIAYTDTNGFDVAVGAPNTLSPMDMPDPQKGECLQKVQNKINTWMLSAMTELGSKLSADCPGQEERSSAARRLMAMTAATERHSQSRMLLAKTGAPCTSNCVENPCAYKCQCLAERSFSRKSRALLDQSDPICPNPPANLPSTQQVAVGAGQKWSNGACCGNWVGECHTPTPRCESQKLEASVSIAGSSKTVNMTTVRYTAAGALIRPR